MRQFCSFWWLCARRAFWGNSSFANDWQWVFGNPLVSTLASLAITAVGAVAPTIAQRLGVTDATTGIPALDSFLGALAAFVLTWLVAYFVKFLNAPVTLFHEQKNRADKLDGLPPVSKKISPVDKQMAVLSERYLSGKPKAVQREQIDYLVDGLKSIEDISAIFQILTTETNAVTKSSNRVAKDAAKAAKNPQKARQALTNFAGDLDFYSNRIEAIINITRQITLRMFEDVSKFIEVTALVTEDDLKAMDVFIATIDGNAISVRGCIEAAASTTKIIGTSFKGRSADLNIASDRAISILAELSNAFGDYVTSCEQLSILAKQRAASEKPRNHQPAV